MRMTAARRAIAASLLAVTTAAILACAASPSLDAADAATRAGPTARQIAAAVNTAERSSSLWATINACTRTRNGRVLVGFRGQMPALSFATRVQMVMSAYYYDASTRSYVQIADSSHTLSLGVLSSGTIQAGLRYTIAAPTRIEGQIVFRWLRDGVVLGSVTRTTTGGHTGVQSATPAGHSAATCSVTR